MNTDEAMKYCLENKVDMINCVGGKLLLINRKIFYLYKEKPPYEIKINDSGSNYSSNFDWEPVKEKSLERSITMNDMISKKTWKEFRDSGLLWWVNMILHTFGWAIVVNIDTEANEIIEAYPARVKFRGFDEKSNTEGYIKVSNYIKDNSEQLEKESRE